MRNKILTVLGILIILLAVATYFIFDINVRHNSQSMGMNVLIAKTNISEGTVIKDINQAAQLFGTQKITQAEAVPNVIRVNAIHRVSEGGLWGTIKSYFVPAEYQANKEDLNNMVNKKIITNIYKNQQIISNYLSNDTTEFKEGEKYFVIQTSYIDSVGAEIKKDDYVDVWIHYTKEKSAKFNQSEKIIGPLKVIKIKDNNNVEIKEEGRDIPKVVMFKLNEEQIKLLSEKSYEGLMFLTKWGISPSQDVTIFTQTSTPASGAASNSSSTKAQ